jgi:hypothetical protein
MLIALMLIAKDPRYMLGSRAIHAINPSMAEGDPVRIIPHRGVDDDCGSVEVWFADGRKSVMFYWDNLVSRRMRSTTLTRQDAIEKATALARAELEKLENPDNPE